MDAFVEINLARDVEGVRTALRRYVAPAQNFVIAESGGDIGYVAGGGASCADWEWYI